VGDAQQQLDKLVEPLPMPAGRTRLAVQVGRAGEEIVAYAAALGIDLIVMAPRQYGTVGRVAFGSVAKSVIRLAPCPVISTPPDVKMPRWLGAVRTVLVPTDLGENARVLFSHAGELARELGAAIRVIHVVVSPCERSSAYLPPPAIITQMQQLTGMRPDSPARVSDTAGQPQSTIRVGDPSQTILSYADEVQADLIVMATHGRHPLARMVLGRVAQKVMQQAHCPVLTLSPGVCQRLRRVSGEAAERADPPAA
jgi:nucleotide-binding universal stress UspA family protein